MEQNRLKSKVAWGSVGLLIILVLNKAGMLDRIGLDQESAEIIVNSILCILVSFGIFNNPVSKKTY